MRPLRPFRAHCIGVLVFAFGGLVALPARGASLTQVNNWGASGVPTYIAMFIYVPNNVASNPPILVVSHYCGGDAAGVFGEAQGGGIVAASDKYGFIMIFPQNHLPGTTRNCWDVGSTASLTHDGGGDTQAIAEMVKYTITTYKANPNRVYATGTSSGAMMTEALLAVYPDIFKAGAEFSGVPAGCWAYSYSASNQWSGPCAGGTVSNTGAQWGTIVHNMYPSYTGHHPRVQLWHGEADPTISYNNQTEAVKEWTNVLGLNTNPTTTATVSFNSHSWTHQSWANSCYTVLDEWSEANGPHGTDANLNATYVIPFLGLDQAGATDPEIAKCGGAGGASGTGGASSAGGTTAAGGSKTGGASSTGGRTGTGGATSMGGSSNAGGKSGVGGLVATGGAQTPTGGSLGLGGSTAAGGNLATGGKAATGGKTSTGNPTGGAETVGGTANNTGGVASATGGSPGVGTTSAAGGALNGGSSSLLVGGTGVSETAGASSTGSPENTGGCSCSVGGQKSAGKLLAMAFGSVLMLRRRKKPGPCLRTARPRLHV